MLNADKVYELLNKIPKGQVTTYGEIAKKLESKAFRGVGRIIGKNPNAPQVPCHRVVRSDGGISGYAFGVDKKIALLKSEGVEILDGKVKDFNEKLFKFS
jgi:methylated-DNA-[protein]-cysteine S-methyltransferase